MNGLHAVGYRAPGTNGFLGVVVGLAVDGFAAGGLAAGELAGGDGLAAPEPAVFNTI